MSGMLEFDFDTAPLWTDPEKIKQLFGDVRKGDILRGRVFAEVASRFLRVYTGQLTSMAPLPVGLMGMIQKEIDALQHGLVEAATMTVDRYGIWLFHPFFSPPNSPQVLTQTDLLGFQLIPADEYIAAATGNNFSQGEHVVISAAFRDRTMRVSGYLSMVFRNIVGIESDNLPGEVLFGPISLCEKID